MKVFFIMLLFLFGSASGYGQVLKTSFAPQFSQVYFSPSFGLMFTDLSIAGGSAQVKTTPELGYSIGIEAFIPSGSPYVDYSTGVFYFYSKTRVETVGGAASFLETTESQLELRRLSVPLVSKIYPFKRSGLFYARLGLLNNFLLNAKRETTSNVTQTNGFGTRTSTSFLSQDLTGTEGYKVYNLDGLIGAGFQTSMFSRFQFLLELNFLYSLTPIATGSNEINSRSYYATIGLGF